MAIGKVAKGLEETEFPPNVTQADLTGEKKSDRNNFHLKTQSVYGEEWN